MLRKRKYMQYVVEFYADGNEKKAYSLIEPGADGRFYDDESGFGGCVTAKSEDEAVEKVRREIMRRRLEAKERGKP